MNKQELDILKDIDKYGFTNQRDLSSRVGYSLGTVNKSIKNLIYRQYLSENSQITDIGKNFLNSKKPKNAIILAAGTGIRMVPLNFECPKALLEVKGEVMIERIIRHLHEVDIYDISIVVGFMQEQFEYLIDEYGVNLISNSSYMTRNNMYSLNLLNHKIHNTYIIPCDIYCYENPFSKREAYSWYMVSDEMINDYPVYITRAFDILKSEDNEIGNRMVGICYICDDIADEFRLNLNELSSKSKYNHSFWETALFNKNKMMVKARIVDSRKFVEINTYEQLRDIDSDSNSLNSEAIDIIETLFNVSKEEINDIHVLKKGMTNRSFIFTCKNKKYIMRIPGEGTDQLINREEEYHVYQTIHGKKISDEVLYMNPKNGYKITRYIENCRVCDSNNQNDLIKSMAKLREFHQSNSHVSHYFNMFEKIDFYESLWISDHSIYRDYEKVKQNVLSLEKFIDSLNLHHSLTHIDAVPDNFLFYEDEFSKEHVRLIDWEYAAMQDPHVDIAMFCIYALYDREQVDNLIDIYFENQCDYITRIKIYAYISICGLLWSNWCEYKRDLGVEFGEYSIKQYRYAKEYYQIVVNELEKEGYSWS